MALNQREKALLAVPVLLGGVMSFYNWVHEPLFLRRAEAKTQVEQVQNELKRDEAKLKREGDLSARASAVANEEQLIDAWVPGKNAAGLLIWYLSRAEQHSGVRIRGITVGEKKQVTAKSAPVPGQAPGQAPAQQQPQNQTAPALTQPAGNQQQSATAPKAAGASFTVTVIRLDMKVEGQFAEHLIFNQAMEQMPLFLNTDTMSLERANKPPFAEASKLLLEGKTYAAEMLLGSSPTVAGTYSVNLYFKSGKPGPDTTPMAFAESAGRMDPFVMDGVDSFIQSILDFSANLGSNTQNGQGGVKYDPDRNPLNSGQMG